MKFLIVEPSPLPILIPISWNLPYNRGNPQLGDCLWRLRSLIAPNEVGNRSPGIYFTAEENPGKPQLGDCLWRLWQIIASNGVPCHQMRSVGLHSTSEREKEGKRKGQGCHENIVPLYLVWYKLDPPWLLFNQLQMKLCLGKYSDYVLLQLLMIFKLIGVYINLLMYSYILSV